MKIIGEKNAALFPLLRGSSAEMQGNHCVIHAAHPALPMLAETPINAASLESALETVCGRAVKFSVESGGEAPATDPFDGGQPDPLDEFEGNLLG